MIHIALHLLVPLAVALALFRNEWVRVFLILLATMLVDLDHLLADPVYDPTRCSIGFHPLHRLPAIALYAALFALPLLRWLPEPMKASARTVSLVGLGLMLHMALDGTDCLL